MTTYIFLQLYQPYLGFSHEYLIKGLEDETVKAYLKYMVDFAVAFGADRERAEKELNETLQFTIDLAKVRICIRPGL